MAILMLELGTVFFCIVTSFLYNKLAAFMPVAVICIDIIIYAIVLKFQTAPIKNEKLYNHEGDTLAEDVISNIYNVKVFDGIKLEIEK